MDELPIQSGDDVVRVRLDAFHRHDLADLLPQFRHAMGGAVLQGDQAVLGDKGTDRPAWPYPGFLRGSETQEDVGLELNINPELGFEIRPEHPGPPIPSLCVGVGHL